MFTDRSAPSTGEDLTKEIGGMTKKMAAAALSILGIASVGAYKAFPGATSSAHVVPTTTTTMPTQLNPLPIDSSAAEALAKAEAQQSASSQTVVVNQAPILQPAPISAPPSGATRIS